MRPRHVRGTPNSPTHCSKPEPPPSAQLENVSKTDLKALLSSNHDDMTDDEELLWMVLERKFGHVNLLVSDWTTELLERRNAAHE
jgi:hypothetical protein